MVEVLAKSGFYYCAKQSARVQCFCCFGYIDDFHRFSMNEINSTHLTRFPYCRHAQLLPQPGEKQSNNRDNLCEWCLKYPRNYVAYPCQHLSSCLSCAQLTGACPRCAHTADAFYKVYT